MFPTQRQRKSGAAPPPPSIRSRSAAKGNRATAMLRRECFVVRACDQTVPVYHHERYSHPDGVAGCRAHFRALSPSLNLAAAVLFLVTQEMFSQSQPPNRGKQLAKLIKFSPPQREHRNDGYCSRGERQRRDAPLSQNLNGAEICLQMNCGGCVYLNSLHLSLSNLESGGVFCEIDTNALMR